MLQRIAWLLVSDSRFNRQCEDWNSEEASVSVVSSKQSSDVGVASLTQTLRTDKYLKVTIHQSLRQTTFYGLDTQLPD